MCVRGGRICIVVRPLPHFYGLLAIEGKLGSFLEWLANYANYRIDNFAHRATGFGKRVVLAELLEEIGNREREGASAEATTRLREGVEAVWRGKGRVGALPCDVAGLVEDRGEELDGRVDRVAF